jgi:hypothetical protein
MAQQRYQSASAVHNGKLYVVGGRDAVARSAFAAAVHGDNLYAVGGVDTLAQRTMEVLALPSPLPWTTTRHTAFPDSFKRAVYTLMHCFSRTNALPDDVLFKIMWLLHRSAFK